MTYFTQNGTPLTPNQILEDISADHAHKTVTIEPFIHSASLQAASVHPCEHTSAVMKKVIERMNNSVAAEQLAQRKGQSSASPRDAKKKQEIEWPRFQTMMKSRG